MRGLLQRPMENHPSVCTYAPNYPPRNHETVPISPYSYVTTTHPVSAPLSNRESPEYASPASTDANVNQTVTTSPPPSPPLGNRSKTILDIMRAGKQRRMANMTSVMTTTCPKVAVTLPRIAGRRGTLEQSTPNRPPPAQRSLERRFGSAMRHYSSLYRHLLANAPPMQLRDYERLLRTNPEPAPAAAPKQNHCNIAELGEQTSVEKTLSWIMETDFEPGRQTVTSGAPSAARRRKK